MKTKIMKIDEVLFDKDTYPRHNPDFVTVARYMNAMKSGAEFPPIVVALLDDKYFLVDGLHRLKATKANKGTHINAEILEDLKDKKEIYVEAVKRNIAHGHQFSTSEVTTICITLEEWNLSKEQITAIVRIPSDKLTAFVAKRAVRVTGENGEENGLVALKKPMSHLSGTTQAISFDGEQESISGGSSQLALVENLIALIKNDWINTTDKLIMKSLEELYNLLALILNTPKLVKTIKSGKRGRPKGSKNKPK